MLVGLLSAWAMVSLTRRYRTKCNTETAFWQSFPEIVRHKRHTPRK